MGRAPGTIDLGKYRVVYEEERKPDVDETDGYLVQQRAIIRLNEELVRLKRAEDYTVFCDENHFKAATGKRPSPLQYFIASIGFCMFSQLTRFAARLGVPFEDLEMDLQMTYDLSGRFPLSDLAAATRGLSYLVKIKSPAPAERVMRVAQLTDKGCHTVNSMRKRAPVTGKMVLNDRKYEIRD
jgi:uncharacterized OsmC-like protein